MIELDAPRGQRPADRRVKRKDDALPRVLAVYLLTLCGIAAADYVASTQAGLMEGPVEHVTITLYLGLS